MATKYALLTTVAALLTCAASPVGAQAQTCDRCGRQGGCHTVCRPVCTTHHVTETEWGCQCEEFCVPGAIEHENCGAACDGCDSVPCQCGTYQAFPHEGEIFTRRKLVRREVTRVGAGA